MEFREFPKIPRFSREIIITEKIDGTNASVAVLETGEVLAGSRTRWITPEADNHGFAKWVKEHEAELRELGVGHHFGEWWGSGINRGYGLMKGDKRFSLFNILRWEPERPECCDVVPTITRGDFCDEVIDEALIQLRLNGSLAAPGFRNPEGIVIFHTAGNLMFKKTLENDALPKGQRRV